MSDLIGFERAVYGRAPDRVARMLSTLRAMAVGNLIDDAGRADLKTDRATMIRRLAGAITALFADPAMELDAARADALMPLGVTMRQLFEVAGGAELDLILRLIGDPQAGAPFGQVAKRFALLSLDSGFDWTASILQKAPPHLAEQMLANLIGTKPVMSLRGMARRDQLLDLASSLAPSSFPATPDHLVMLTTAWMLSSYAGTPRKHEMKRQFNDRLRAMAAAWGLSDAPLPEQRVLRARPVLLFAAEIIHSRHVQYRYFGQYLRQLRRRFDLVLLAEDKEADEAVIPLFDRVTTFRRKEDCSHLGEIGRMIGEIAPDIIFYPSVGMRHWGPLFANLRLAPVQLTALGHSASTFCKTIDYYLLEEGYVSDPGLLGETVITVPDDSLIFERPPHYVPLAPAIRRAPERLRIVMPSNLLKLNPGFVSVVGRIREAAARPLDLHFLPASSGLEYDAARTMITRIVPGAFVHPQLAYDRYLAVLSECDLNLSPFPFGGLHSVIDSLRQGLPVVAMECPEPHGRTDAMLLRRLGLPDWLIARNEEEYIAAALRLIADDDLRVAIAERAVALDIDRLMFGDATTPLRSEIDDAVWWIYRNHEAARADGRKLWCQADRVAFEA